MSANQQNLTNNTDRISEELRVLEVNKANIRDAIISKGQDVAEDAPLSIYAQKISNIVQGTDTSDANATNADLVQGKTAYVQGEKIEGTLVDKSNATLSATGTLTSNSLVLAVNYIPQGYYYPLGSNLRTMINNSTLANIIGLTPEKIAEGVTILGITGTYTG